ncbi:tetratricopeptide repeat protein [Psychrobacter sp. ANT_WB68]|uniref:tetratricopeptide repeat protein n=1 Tax=Psychrobacter sp. ANT_WB68 TaxID=2597355 RepID=UPI0011F33A3D|nr:tetratricopeptide repeat protein [Psychrobacter sp. ANT_WB68]KAA0914259.1 tetratricopeptide repeat protein [Psychrobacter sp. ANT_WB68]
MINTKIYKSIYVLAEKLLEADSKNDQKTFDVLYAQLKDLCIENEKSDKDHPEQWETLADFTEDLDEALVIYQKALDKAAAINSKDHLASIAFSMAELQIELGQTDAAIENLQNAKISANKIEDREFKVEINELLTKLLAQ